jgi:hypothetical protein
MGAGSGWLEGHVLGCLSYPPTSSTNCDNEEALLGYREDDQSNQFNQ